MDRVQFTKLVQGWYSEDDPVRLDARILAVGKHDLDGWQPYIRHRMIAKRKGMIPRKRRGNAA